MNEELVAAVKEIVADPAKGPALHDLLHAEASRVIEAMRDEQFAAGTAYSKDELARRAAAYEALTEELARAAAMVAYWRKTTDDRLVPGELTGAIEAAKFRSPAGSRINWLEAAITTQVSGNQVSGNQVSGKHLDKGSMCE